MLISFCIRKLKTFKAKTLETAVALKISRDSARRMHLCEHKVRRQLGLWLTLLPVRKELWSADP